MKYPLVFSNRHYVFEIDGKSMLLDTGSPSSFFFENPGKIEVGNKSFQLKASPIPGMKENTEKLVDEKVDGIIGLDIISLFTVVIEKDICFFDVAEIVDEEQLKNIDNLREYHKDHGTIDFTDKFEGMRDAVTVPLKTARGILSFDAEVNGRQVTAFLDTGASNSYAAPSVLAGLESSGTTEDYFALQNEWDTSRVYYNVETKIAGKDFKLRFCTNPRIQGAYNLPEDTAIMGAEELYFDTLVIDISGKKMILL